ALSARVATLEAELAEMDAALAHQREALERLSAEARSLEATVERATSGSPRVRAAERMLYAALVAPAAGGLGMIMTLVVAGMIGSLAFGERALPAASVIAMLGGLYAGWHTARKSVNGGQKQ